jgi:hypothetical protein
VTAAVDRSTPVIEFAGDIPVLLPCASDYLAERDLEALRAVENEARRGRRALAHRMALALEQRLGITAEDRIAAMRAESEGDQRLEAAIGLATTSATPPPKATKKGRRKRSIFDPLPQVVAVRTDTISELPAGERGRSDEEVRRWERSQQVLTSPHLKLSAEQKDAHAAIMADVEQGPRRRAEISAIADRLDEVASKAQAQGLKVERSKRGRVNVVDWDAVKSIAQSGSISGLEVEVASHFKELYEKRFADSGAASYGDARGGGHDHEAFIANRAERAIACEVIGRAERAIALHCSGNPSALQIFRGVLDENKALSTYGKGRAFERHLDALKHALGVAHAEWLRWKKDRRDRYVVASRSDSATA